MCPSALKGAGSHVYTGVSELDPLMITAMGHKKTKASNEFILLTTIIFIGMCKCNWCYYSSFVYQVESEVNSVNLEPVGWESGS